MTILLKSGGNTPSFNIISSDGSATEDSDEFQDGAARRELQQRGFGRMWWSK